MPADYLYGNSSAVEKGKIHNIRLCIAPCIAGSCSFFFRTSTMHLNSQPFRHQITCQEPQNLTRMPEEVLYTAVKFKRDGRRPENTETEDQGRGNGVVLYVKLSQLSGEFFFFLFTKCWTFHKAIVAILLTLVKLPLGLHFSQRGERNVQ